MSTGCALVLKMNKSEAPLLCSYYYNYLKQTIMSVLKVVEILSESPESWEDATKKGIAKASESIKNIQSAYVKEHTVTVNGGGIEKYRVNLKVTFAVN